MYAGIDSEILNPQETGRLAAVRAFLATFGLTFNDEMEYTVLLRQDGKLIGTGSFAGEVLRNIAVDEAAQGEGLTAKIISLLLRNSPDVAAFTTLYLPTGLSHTPLCLRQIAKQTVLPEPSPSG